MKTLEQKTAKAWKKEFDLNGFEVRNVIRTANRRNKIMTATIESWYAAIKTGSDWQTVECHMMDGLTGEPLDTVTIECCMFDRRQSFIHKTADEIK